jgi:hypothetical protein
MMKKLAIIICLFSLALSGCVKLVRETPTIQTFMLTGAQVEDVTEVSSGPVMKVRTLKVNKPYDTRAFIYLFPGAEVRRDYYNQFVDFPDTIITQYLAGRVRSFSLPDSVRSKRDALQYEVRGTVDELFVDFQKENAPRSVMSVTLSVFDCSRVPYTVIFKERYAQSVLVASIQPQDIVEGWNTCLNAIVDDFEKSLRAALTKKGI